MTNPYFRLGVTEYERQTAWTGDCALLMAVIAALRQWRPAPPFVEIASGSARIAREAVKRLHSGPWVAVDLEREMLPTARNGLSPIVARGEALPLRSSSVGAVACWSGLHYIGAQSALLECVRILRPGGLVVAAQKVADSLRDDLAWYQDVQEARSTASREWYFSDDLIRAGERCGFRHENLVRHRRWQRLRLVDWASRYGYFDESRTKILLAAAERGRDPEFSRRTGFAVEGEDVIFPTDWAVITWRSVSGDPVDC